MLIDNRQIAGQIDRQKIFKFKQYQKIKIDSQLARQKDRCKRDSQIDIYNLDSWIAGKIQKNRDRQISKTPYRQIER